MNCLTTKASNLMSLAAKYNVPDFQIIHSDLRIDFACLDESSKYIVRGCLSNEDQKQYSLAGQGISCGPISISEIYKTTARIFSETSAEECIIQKYVNGESGVLFCLSPRTAFLEYSKLSNGVTSGKVNPFVAVFPNNLARYKNLSKSIESIFEEYGRCDIEFVGLEDPCFVQVRPITTDFSFCEELFCLKMQLQELEYDSWTQDEFCHDLAESPDFDKKLIELFCETRNNLCKECNLIIESVTESDFIKIGTQIFVRESLTGTPYGNWLAFLSFGKWLWKNFQELSFKFKNEELNEKELMKFSFILRLIYGLSEKLPIAIMNNWKCNCLQLRISCRQRLLSKLQKNILSSHFRFSGRLGSAIKKSSEELQWVKFTLANKDGVVVVNGDFEDGPWVRYERENFTLNEKAFLVTDELYPQIYKEFPFIKGIICKGGAITSHLAILAREHKIPLWIQVSDAYERFLHKDAF